MLLVACMACASTKGLIKPGAKAPEVVGEAADGSTVALSQVRGAPAVVYFYPKDETPGCTTEACAFRDVWDQYTAQGVQVFGVSGDDMESHREFRKAHELPFVLVADTDGKVMEAYGVGSTLGMASRVTFLVGPDGQVAQVWPDVDPGVHAKEVLLVAKGLAPATAK